MNGKEIIFLSGISKLETNEERWNPFPWYREMREHNPIFFDEQQRVWNVFRYEDVKRVLSDYKTFTSERERSTIPIQLESSINLTSVDPPEHRKRRGLLASAFTPRSLDAWKPRIQAVVDFLIQGISAEDLSKPVDIYERFAVRLPVTIIADLLGVPNSDWEQIKEWSDILFLPHHQEEIEETTKQKAKVMKEFGEYLLPLVKQKRSQPQDDILSDLTQAEYEGTKLTDEEVVGSGIGLLGAGNETTTTWLTQCFYYFAKEGVYPQLRKQPELIPQACEEVLRYHFIASLDRAVKEDTDVLGVPMKRGEIVIAWMSSANRDERQFVGGETFDIHRQNSKEHLSFGNGQHFCLGAPLARLETQYAMTSFMKEFANIRLVEGYRPWDHLVSHGSTLTSLPMYIDR
ncbi:cytochrome P450 [Brevibacillus centrosporus]|uniref:cytochrome P450 n=1 Tax=Brevibacillus centrosporus TaxID=54910 RepID=UPI003B02156A